MPTDSSQFWDNLWGGDSDHDFWKQVDPEVARIIADESPELRPEVLDLGCGLGRHAIAFAGSRFRVTATDVSEVAVSHVRRWATDLGLEIQTRVCRFTDNAFPPDTFDFVLSENVIYHGHRDDIVRAVGNVCTWLRANGRFYFTCPTLDDGDYQTGERIAPQTVKIAEGHIHFCADWAELEDLLGGFRIVSRKRRDHQWDDEGTARFSSRWQVLAEKA